jgi:hypothetical protein
MVFSYVTLCLFAEYYDILEGITGCVKPQQDQKDSTEKHFLGIIPMGMKWGSHKERKITIMFELRPTQKLFNLFGFGRVFAPHCKRCSRQQ